VRREANNYRLFYEDERGKRESLPMKMATPEEIEAVGNAFRLILTDGVSVDWRPGTPNAKPIGLYKGKDTAGKEIHFAYLFLANGPASKRPCGE